MEAKELGSFAFAAGQDVAGDDPEFALFQAAAEESVEAGAGQGAQVQGFGQAFAGKRDDLLD